MKMNPVVAQRAPQKPYRLSLVQDHKRRGFGYLLFWLMVHGARQDGEDLVDNALQEDVADGVVCLSKMSTASLM
jgi:hypothetical protein